MSSAASAEVSGASGPGRVGARRMLGNDEVKGLVEGWTPGTVLRLGAPMDNNSTLDLLVRAIADEVAAKVKSTLAADRQTGRIQPVLLNVKDAAVYLGRSEQSVQHLIFQGELPVVRVGRRIHLDRRDLDAWIEQHKH